jgi:hypothetical protein
MLAYSIIYKKNNIQAKTTSIKKGGLIKYSR